MSVQVTYFACDYRLELLASAAVPSMLVLMYHIQSPYHCKGVYRNLYLYI